LKDIQRVLRGVAAGARASLLETLFHPIAFFAASHLGILTSAHPMASRRLSRAAAAGDVDAVVALLRQGADPGFQVRMNDR
tara:strand:+ start:215 stop:457 length:243 start_codon:yes stop_codon:yes gene_type:complete